MTKLREPVTIENTLKLLVRAITPARAAAVTGKSAGYLTAASDPDKRELLSMADAILLDLEHRAQGGVGYPLFETYGLLIENHAAERFADAASIGRHAVAVARENGEACAALMEVSFPGATVSDYAVALRELEESDRATGAAIGLLRELIDRARPHPQPP